MYHTLSTDFGAEGKDKEVLTAHVHHTKTKATAIVQAKPIQDV